MQDFNFSQKLSRYLKKVQDETGTEIKFLESSDLGIGGITAAYRYHPDYILIILKQHYHREKSDKERSIAHEATHGYIIHKLGFCRTEFADNILDEYKRDVQLVLTMVEDIVVNKIIYEAGFPPFGHEYLPMVVQEIKVSRLGEIAGEEFYHKFAETPHLEALLMISRYILAWGFLRYYNLKEEDRDLIKEFTRVFEKNYPDYYPYASKITEILEENDIFLGKSECRAVTEILKLFKLDGAVKLVRS